MTKANAVVLHRDCRPQEPRRIEAFFSWLAGIGARQRTSLAPERWSAHMLRDVGLEGLADGTPRLLVSGHLGWPAR